MSNYSKEERELISQATNGRCGKCGKELGEDFYVEHIIPLSKGGEDAIHNLIGVCEDCGEEKTERLVDPILYYEYITEECKDEIEGMYQDIITGADSVNRENLFSVDISLGGIEVESNVRTSADVLQEKMGATRGGKKGKARVMNKSMHGKNKMIHKMSTQSGMVSIGIRRALYTDLPKLEDIYYSEKRNLVDGLSMDSVENYIKESFILHPMYVIVKKGEVIGFFGLAVKNLVRGSSVKCICLSEIVLKYVKTAEYVANALIGFAKKIVTALDFGELYVACTYAINNKANYLLANLISRSGDTVFKFEDEYISLISGEKLYYKDASYIINTMLNSSSECQNWMYNHFYGDDSVNRYLFTEDDWDGEKILKPTVRNKTRERVESEHGNLNKAVADGNIDVSGFSDVLEDM